MLGQNKVNNTTMIVILNKLMLSAVNCSISQLDYISIVKECLLPKWQQHWNVQPHNAASSSMFQAIA
jgi:hypothetical protein